MTRAHVTNDPQPTQPIIKTKERGGVPRFRENMIVCAILERSGLSLDQVTKMGPPEDLMQFAQLIGCSVDDRRFDVIRPNLPSPIAAKTKGYWPQPMQPVAEDKHGVVRFRSNKIVRELLDRDTERGRTYPDYPARTDGGLNWIGEQDFPQADEEQFAQLIGYSICGYHELSYVSDESAARASALAREVMPEAGGCRDEGCPIHGGPLEDTRTS